MSAIYKLSIQGIRSFDSNDRETIEFGKPLTLIVGTNGSGKTTIIECLKYATSGDLPPNSKGGAFVHDPKITGEKDIRAQVKLAFTSANNLNMIVTRNIQLLVKKTTTTFKTLEGQLVIVNANGNRNTLSTRSVELDSQVPLYMGVPKAILEYVIFCHQEDSLWPLSEPSNLKKKFDEIFQAMKFTKALDSLKGIKKDMSVDIKLLKQSVEHLKVDRDRSKATKVNISELQSKIESYQQQVKGIESQLVEVTGQSDKLFKSNQDFQKVLSKLETLENNRESIKEQIRRLTSAIDLIDSPKMILEQSLANFSSLLQQKEEEVRRLEDEVRTMKARALDLRNKCNVSMRRQGELTATKDSHEKKIQAIGQMLNNLAATYDLSKVRHSDSGEVMKELKSIKDRIQSEKDKFAAESRVHLDDLDKELSSLKHSAIVQSERLDYSLKDKEKFTSEIKRLETELGIIDFSEEDLQSEKSSLEKYNQKLNDWSKVDSVGSINLEIKEKNNQMMILENELETLQERISKTSEQANIFAKLSFIKKSIQEKNDELQEKIVRFESNPIVAKWCLKYGQKVELEFKNFYSKLQNELENKKLTLSEVDKAYTEASLKMRNEEIELKNNEETLANLSKSLEEALPEDCPIEDYHEAVLESEASYRVALENLKMHQTTVDFNKKALEVAERESSCYLCSRKFESDGFKSKLLSTLKAKTDVKFEDTLRDTLASEKEFLDALRSLEKDILALEVSKSRIEALKSSTSKLEEELVTLKTEKDAKDREYNLLEKDKINAEMELRPLVEYFVRTKGEIKLLVDQSKAISDDLVLYGTSEDGVKTVEELQTVQRNKNDSLRTLRREINHLQEEKELKSGEYGRLITLIKEKNLKVSEIEKELSIKENMESDILIKSRELQKLNTSIEDVERYLEDQREKIRNKELLLSDEREKFETSNVRLDLSLNRINDHLKQFVELKDEIDSFTSGGLEELAICTRELEQYQRELDSLNQDIEGESSKLVEKTQEIRESNNEKKNIKQNLELLELKTSLSVIEEDIASLDVSNAEAERDKYQQESLRLRSLFERLSSENAGKLGEIKQLQNQVQAFTRQLGTDYKDVDNDYHRRWVELQTRTFVTDDIDTYSRALDSAIMKYHGLKMQDINRIIDELWKRTYSGTDVDTIQIRSDEVSSNVKGKSYNYRVVMYKQDAELDMRGRCSAGQKVLASIIIRLALSETFGVNCGVIALDEPTTNLDEENIESLAKSLGNIIEMRRHQKNFQLIVITHDEKFLNHMNASKFTDHFFRVKRDDRQKSQIEWVDINKVTD